MVLCAHLQYRTATVYQLVTAVLPSTSRLLLLRLWHLHLYSTAPYPHPNSVSRVSGMWQALQKTGWMNRGLYFSFLQTNKLLKCFDINQFTQNIGISDQMFSPSPTQTKREFCWWYYSSKTCFPYQENFQAWTKAELRPPDSLNHRW